MRRGSDAISLALFGTDENEGARSDAGVRTTIEDNGEDKGGMFVNDKTVRLELAGRSETGDDCVAVTMMSRPTPLSQS